MISVVQLLVLLCGYSLPLCAQESGWRLVGSDIVLTSFEGDLRGPGYISFVSESRNPALFFPADSATGLTRTPRHTTGGIQFRFRFINSAHSGSEAWAGFGRSETEARLYGLQHGSDTLQIRSQSQFFNISGGYNRLYRSGKRFSFRLGGHLMLGFSTGSRIHHGSNRFFADHGSQAGLGAVLGVRFRFRRNTFLVLDQQPSFWRTTIDGSVFRGTSRSTTIGIEWHL